MTQAQYKAPLFITIHKPPKWKYGIALPYTRPHNRTSPYSTQSQTYNYTLFISRKLNLLKRNLTNSIYRQSSLRFSANYPSKIFVAQIYKFYFQQKPKGIFFFIFICISTQLSSFWNKTAQKETERQPWAVAPL